MTTAYTDFSAMSKAEAAEYLKGFLSDQQRALDRFASIIGSDLSRSRRSLEQVWGLVEPMLEWRIGYLPPAVGQPSRPIGADLLEPPEELPSWFHHPSSAGYARFSSDTLWLIDGAARHLGDVLVQNSGGRWESGESRDAGYMFQNQPVIAGVRSETVNPIQTCSVLAAKSLRSDGARGIRSLVDVYDTWRAQPSR